MGGNFGRNSCNVSKSTFFAQQGDGICGTNNKGNICSQLGCKAAGEDAHSCLTPLPNLLAKELTPEFKAFCHNEATTHYLGTKMQCKRCATTLGLMARDHEPIAIGINL